jgi:hypothetical protein
MAPRNSSTKKTNKLQSTKSQNQVAKKDRKTKKEEPLTMDKAALSDLVYVSTLYVPLFLLNDLYLVVGPRT